MSFGIKITEEEFTDIKNVLDIAKFVKEKGGEFTENEVDWKTILNQETNIKLPRSAWIGKLMRFILKPMFSFYFSLKKKGRIKFFQNLQYMLETIKVF